MFPDMGSAWVAGVDGCRAGWVVVLRATDTGEVRARVVATFGELLRMPERPGAIAIDVPIGLPAAAVAGGREADRLARGMVGPRASSVFSPPSRRALAAFRRGGAYAEVSAANAGEDGGPRLTLQCFGILPKIDEVDAGMTTARQRAVREAHPELCFAEAAGGGPMRHPKKTAAGRRERLAVLRALEFPPIQIDAPRAHVQPDDVLDAAITCWTAMRMARGEAIALPARPVRDPRGLRMEIVR